MKTVYVTSKYVHVLRWFVNRFRPNFTIVPKQLGLIRLVVKKNNKYYLNVVKNISAVEGF